MLHTLGKAGQAVALLCLFFIVLSRNLLLQGRSDSHGPSLTLGLLLNAETFIRDFAMRELPAGYLAVQHVAMFLGLASLPA
jgi:hypothetical protein